MVIISDKKTDPPQNEGKEMEEFRDAHQKFCDEDWSFEKAKPLPPAPAPAPAAQQKRVVTKPTWSSSSSQTSSAYADAWSFADAELKRQRRVVKYRSYAVEGKIKTSVKNSFRWIKNKYCQYIYG